mmetsp:Transcript_5853/g.7680  ORF Transcript_5853/g.7680 Transcript_5853/m.7680 type:complete len:192 (+) Transcript_5853:116-691(+)
MKNNMKKCTIRKKYSLPVLPLLIAVVYQQHSIHAFQPVLKFHRHNYERINYHPKHMSSLALRPQSLPLTIIVSHLFLFPDKIEDWECTHVQEWLTSQGYGRYCDNFSSDDVDGDRLIYLGTPDQLDHIEWQMDCLGIDEEDQKDISDAIESLVSDGIISDIPVTLQGGGDEGEQVANELEIKHSPPHDYHI